jgi:hypothetical protein
MKKHTAEAIAVQAWIELNSQDPEAVSALAVARANLEAGRKLTSLRRLRCIELKGARGDAAAIGERLHRSTQFYNPHKERCSLRFGAADAAPVPEHGAAVLVTERGAERMSAAERWWRHETGEIIEVRQGVVWVMTFDRGERSLELADELALLRDRRHGLLCNPHCQDYRVSGTRVPVPWIEALASDTPITEVGHAGLDSR